MFSDLQFYLTFKYEGRINLLLGLKNFKQTGGYTASKGENKTKRKIWDIGNRRKMKGISKTVVKGGPRMAAV